MKRRYLSVVMGLLGLTIVLMAGCSQSGSGAYQVSGNSYLVNGTITVNPASYYNVQFTVTSAMKQPTVTGSFTAFGGSGNDIIALVIDDKYFTHWVNGYEVNTLYDSGRLTTAAIDMSILTPGTYHLVFSNRFSLLSSKQVSTSVNFHWYSKNGLMAYTLVGAHSFINR